MNEKIQQLRKELQEETRKEEQAIIKSILPDIKKKYEGKYFKYENSFSCPVNESDYWYIYYKVIEIIPGSIRISSDEKIDACCKVLKFETDKTGEITIHPVHETYIQHLGTEIQEIEFMKALQCVIDTINNINC